MTIDEARLKECPFCGAKAHLWEWTHGTAICCTKYSKNHLVQIEAKTREEAIILWNTRANEVEE